MENLPAVSLKDKGNGKKSLRKNLKGNEVSLL